MPSLPNNKKTKLPLWVGIVVYFACGAIVCLGAFHVWAMRKADLRSAEIEMQNLAGSLTQHANDTFALADTILVGLVDRLETDGTGPAAIDKIQQFLRLRKNNERVHGVFAYDENGKWLATTEDVDYSVLNNADRDYFQRHRASPERGTYIGRPVRSRSGGQWVLTASRRFNKPDGSFGGVALTTVDIAYFAKYYGKFDVGPHGMIALMSSDGMMLARSRDFENFVGRDFSKAELFVQKPLVSEKVFYFKSPVDGTERLSFYQHSDRYPLTILATKSMDDVLVQWRREAMILGLLIGLLVALLGIAGVYLVSYITDRQRMVRALRSREADFRLLAEQSSDMVMRIDVDGIVRYVSPSCSRVIGRAADQIEGKPALGGINSEDKARVEQAIDGLRRGELDETRIIYRNRHPEKGEIWIESALRVTRSLKNGDIDGVVAITRDVTEHKDLEARLASLAAHDGLTGLANRRCFDETLERELSHAKRDGTSLSLLMIDVDHFKSFNDLYGHQAGDDCLRKVAEVVRKQACRPGDLAARYGGEEFALLLPDTDAVACEAMAERLQLSLLALEIRHEGNLPSKLVTVSLGGACSAQVDGDDSALVGAADGALYEAKGAGRNRFVMAAENARSVVAFGRR